MTAWTDAATSTGSTDSEKYLVRLARRAFLSLWSYPNVFTDEGRRGRGDGKELCDLLIVFGDDVVLFSDKHCEFIPHPDINVAWSRWYKRAIEKSAKQLAGAEAWLARFPDRLYLDSTCKSPLPIKIPDPERRRVHLIAVTRGSSEASRVFWGAGSSGSLMIDTKVTGREHYSSPFRVGKVLPNRRFVHVLDETTLDIVLRELDTISDFVSYLTKKQEWMSLPGVDCVVPGEEELIANYLRNFDPDEQEHYFPKVPHGALVVLREGDWVSLQQSQAYRNRCMENEISYLWDEIIEFQNLHIMDGNASTFQDGTAIPIDSSNEVYERVMRMMAEESRLIRRTLGKGIDQVRRANKRDMRFTRTIVCGPERGRAYVLLSLPQPKDLDYEAYKALRQEQLHMYSVGCKLKFSHIQQVVGIAFEPAKAKTFSVDYLAINFGTPPLDPTFAREIRQKLDEANMWSSKAIKSTLTHQVPLPMRGSKLKTLMWNIGAKAKGLFRI